MLFEAATYATERLALVFFLHIYHSSCNCQRKVLPVFSFMFVSRRITALSYFKERKRMGTVPGAACCYWLSVLLAQRNLWSNSWVKLMRSALNAGNLCFAIVVSTCVGKGVSYWPSHRKPGTHGLDVEYVDPSGLFHRNVCCSYQLLYSSPSFGFVPKCYHVVILLPTAAGRFPMHSSKSTPWSCWNWNSEGLQLKMWKRHPGAKQH